MAQTSIEMQFQLLLNKATTGDRKAILELADCAFQALQQNEDPQKCQFGLTLLRTLGNCGDKASQEVLAEKISNFAIQIFENTPEVAFKLFSLAGKLGNLLAKDNLAVCFFKGQGTKRNPDKAISLLKECYNAGRKAVLEDINAIAKDFVYGTDGITPDLQKAVELWTFAAQAGHAVALENLALLGGWFYSGVSPCPQDISQGIAILKLTAQLGDKRALHNLEAAGSEIINRDPKIGFELFHLASELGNFQAKRNLAVCFFKKQGTERNLDKAIGLLKECYNAGRKAVLEDMNAIAKAFVYGTDGIAPDLQKAVELWTFAAQAGHAVALENLALLGGWFYSGIAPCPQDIPRGIEILKVTAKLGNGRALHNLNAAAAEMIKTDPKVGFELLSLATEFGNLDAKRNLAVCFLDGIGTERDVNKAISLFKACYNAGNASALEELNTIASRVLSGSHGCQKNIELGIKLFAYIAQEGFQSGQDNLLILANHFLKWQKFNVDYGIQQDISKGLKILHYLAETLKNPKAEEQLTQIRALKIPIPMPNVPESRPRFTSNDLTIGLDTPEEPHSPCTAEFLRKNNISILETGVRIQGNFSFSQDTTEQFKTNRSTKKLQHFSGVLSALNAHFPPASVIQETICAYIPNEVSPLFFQYQRALAALDKEPQLECLNTEETPCDPSPVQLHVSCV